MNMFKLFMMITAIAGSIGAVMAAKSQAGPSPWIATSVGIAIGAIVYFGPLRLAAMAVDIIPGKKGGRSGQLRDFPILFICLWLALLPAVACASAYWLVIRVW
jgi:hypothetical protein